MSEPQPSGRLSGLPAFTVICSGQVISLLGTAMTSFAVMVWAWEVTGEATTLALLGFFQAGAIILFSPLAGVAVDRWSRKSVMLWSDLGAGLVTVGLLVLYLSGDLSVWHLFVAKLLAGGFQALQLPAYSAAITMMLPKEQFARANGMVTLAQSAPRILAPALAAVLMPTIGIAAIMVIDLATVSAAVVGLLLAIIPEPARSPEAAGRRKSIWRQAGWGFSYIIERRSLLALQLVFSGANLVGTFGLILRAPMILARTGNDEVILGTVMSAFGLGGVAGSLVLSAWGGPKRRIHGVLAGIVLACVGGHLVMGVGDSLPVWMVGAFVYPFFIVIVNGCNQAIWQAKVAPESQGRVFATRMLIAQLSSPLAMLAAGPLADHLLEPAMASGGWIAGTFGPVAGSGPGSGMAVIFLLAGAFGGLVGLFGYSLPMVRKVERLVPDHEEAAQAAPAARAEGQPRRAS